MTRINGVSRKEAGPLVKALYWFARREFGAVPEPVAVMAHHPALVVASARHELAVKKAVKTSAHGPLFELCVYRTAVRLGCSWCVDFGAMLMKHGGLDIERLKHIDSYATSPLFTDLERKALAYADAMTGTPVSVPAGQVAELEDLLGRKELVALTYQIALENQRARFNSAFEIKDQGFTSGDACRAPAH
ncbi:Alkylhydroperoxidase family enzyme, contains CxxC motif [Lentzea xinjiangensis]|uniref:Alkylhydroperoxidase family enzyme, contains CxxC motif n=1 Tax=Lentzea xinjiangensis TaxID=402600 RepID=A0A1H9HJJ6_9PSEU|nr:carboxymuconolactone decarboxylase family protein [Lentzea xinjiangensis]SEQ62520.1 Alkylhydroperoxidase family enzyme, contains CxxC motif [Lentzea xinjiangensis]